MTDIDDSSRLNGWSERPEGEPLAWESMSEAERDVLAGWIVDVLMAWRARRPSIPDEESLRGCLRSRFE